MPLAHLKLLSAPLFFPLSLTHNAFITDLFACMYAGGSSEAPAPSSDIIRRVSMPSQTVAVLRFENPATEPVVRPSPQPPPHP